MVVAAAMAMVEAASEDITGAAPMVTVELWVVAVVPVGSSVVAARGRCGASTRGRGP